MTSEQLPWIFVCSVQVACVEDMKGVQNAFHKFQNIENELKS